MERVMPSLMPETATKNEEEFTLQASNACEEVGWDTMQTLVLDESGSLDSSVISAGKLGTPRHIEDKSFRLSETLGVGRMRQCPAFSDPSHGGYVNLV